MLVKYIDALELIKTQGVETMNSYLSSVNKFEKIILIGNGGSNSIASHIAEDLAKFYKKKALSFSDSSMLTCFINDFGMENAYVEFLKVYSSQDTLNIFISSSGESKNILNCVSYAEKNKLNYGLLTGFGSDNSAMKLSKTSLFNFNVDSKDYGVIECTHQIFLHLAI